MKKKFLYFQPCYVDKFKCDGSKCDARCCKGWNIFIDEKTHKQYSHIKPKADAKEILSHMTFNDERKEYLVTMRDDKTCPFLTEDNLCRLQRTYGEKFLSVTCSSFPRRSLNFGNFFERSLLLTCPVAAQMILFNEKPMEFEFVEVPEKVHSNGGKIGIAPVNTLEGFAEHMLEIQIAQISILQERTLTIDQRLIVLGFFLDRFDEIISAELGRDALTQLIAAYESKTFLTEQVPLMLASVNFDVKKFFKLMFDVLESLYGVLTVNDDMTLINSLAKTLDVVPDANGQISASGVIANYERLADARKNFLARRSTVLENYLVNELFLNCYPWRHATSIAKNYGAFVAQYKFFELLVFAADKQGFTDNKDLIKFADWFAGFADHNNDFIKKILDGVPDDILTAIETLLDPR